MAEWGTSESNVKRSRERVGQEQRGNKQPTCKCKNVRTTTPNQNINDQNDRTPINTICVVAGSAEMFSRAVSA